MAKYLNKNGVQYLWQKMLGRFLTVSSLKTINNESIVGSGNIVIQGGGSEPEVTVAEVLEVLESEE